MALRTIKGSAETKDRPVFAAFDKITADNRKSDHLNVNINDIMKNLSMPQFTYDSFKAAYDVDPQIQELVDNFNEDGITINADSSSDDSVETDSTDTDYSVTQAAKAATDIGDSPLD